MSDENGGQFKKGRSGNPRGRPKKDSPPLETIDDFNELVINTLNSPTVVRTNEGEKSMSLIKRAVLSLMSSSPANRLAAISTIELMRSSLKSREYRRSVERQRKRDRGEVDE